MGIVVGRDERHMRGLQWHYDRLAEEFRGHARTTSTDVSGVVRRAGAAESRGPAAQGGVAPLMLAAGSGQG